MKTYKENDSVIFTDNEGNRYDTFVIFDTDRKTGLTHLNHQNLKVVFNVLELHERSSNRCTMPMNDSLSFELFKQLKEKFINYDLNKKTRTINSNKNPKVINLLAKASKEVLALKRTTLRRLQTLVVFRKQRAAFLKCNYPYTVKIIIRPT